MFSILFFVLLRVRSFGLLFYIFICFISLHCLLRIKDYIIKRPVTEGLEIIVSIILAPSGELHTNNSIGK